VQGRFLHGLSGAKSGALGGRLTRVIEDLDTGKSGALGGRLSQLQRTKSGGEAGRARTIARSFTS